uniref:Thioredoxin domain-containing protein 17 n=1 Tax=Glossina brevipalpis TaxID=37001 RepID=A0A1A9W328_9MUSC
MKGLANSVDNALQMIYVKSIRDSYFSSDGITLSAAPIKGGHLILSKKNSIVHFLIRVKSMVREELAKGYENFREAAANLSELENKKLYVFFIGERDATGKNWCSDCEEAEHIFAQAIEEYADANSIILRVEVGDKLAWADQENPFHKDSDLRLQEIPTLVRWKTVIHLHGDQCKQIELLELLFHEEDI